MVLEEPKPSEEPLPDVDIEVPARLIELTGGTAEQFAQQLEKDGILWICPCLGYHSEWPLYGLKDNEAKTHIADALQMLDL